jgi:hypothetical protein
LICTKIDKPDHLQLCETYKKINTPTCPNSQKHRHFRIDLYKNQQPNIHKQKHPLDLQKHKHPKIPNSQSKPAYVSEDSQNSCNKNSTHKLHSHNLFLPKILTILDVINFRSPPRTIARGMLSLTSIVD